MTRPTYLTALLTLGLAAAAVAGTATPQRGPHGRMDKDGDGAISAAEWNAHFAELDADGDGRLEPGEMPHHPPGPPEGAGAGLIALGADGDGDGAVSAAEWAARVAALDTDRDGALAVGELPRPPHGRGHGGGAGLPPFLAAADEDGDGALGAAELQALFAAADRNGDGNLGADEMPFARHHRGH